MDLTLSHCDRVKLLLVEFGRYLGLEPAKIDDLSLLGQYHDLGKTEIPPEIIYKPGPLSAEERSIMQQHPTLGKEIIHELKKIAHLVEGHHEFFDGTGYPNGVKGDNIPLECRMLAVADSYDAMISARPYRLNPLTHDDAIEELLRCSGVQFDPVVVKAFIQMMEEKKVRGKDGRREVS